MASKEVGIHFRKHNDAGIAKINITNDSTATPVVVNDLVDLFIADKDDSLDEYEDFVYRRTLDSADDSYTILVEHSGDHNPSAVGPDYSIDIVKMLEVEDLEPPRVDVQLTSWHSDYPSDTYVYDIEKLKVTQLYKIVPFNGDDIETIFVLPTTVHASKFVEFSVDGGTTWHQPTSTLIEWGKNNPDYDDEEINSVSGKFGINFYTPPASGVGNVQIKYIPMVNKYKVLRTMYQPNDGISYVDRVSEVRLLDDALELIKE